MSDFKIVQWHKGIDLTEYYAGAEAVGHVNNASQKMLIDCFNNEREFVLNLLYEDDTIIGTQIIHTFDEVGPNAWRAGRTSLIKKPPDEIRLSGMSQISKLQNYTDQFFHSTAIKFVTERNGELYSTTNANPEGSQSLVNKIYFPKLAKMGIVENLGEMDYRYTKQTLWKFNFERFWELYNLFPKWKLSTNH
jgi:hypothetical protein